MDDLISKFVDITGVEPERAEFYLLSAAGRLETALECFYEVTESGNQEPLANSVEETPTEEPTLSQVSQSMSKMDPSKSESKPKTNTRFGTLASLQNRDSSSDEEGQAFYAGGSVNSGQQVLGPSKKKNDIVNDMFKTCQEQSIPMDERTSSQQQPRPRTFGGTGYKLGQTSGDTEVIPAAGTEPGSSSTQTGVITLKLWRDGFTINDRELRSYNDPQNREFMEAIKRAEIPMELRQEVQEAEVRLDMEDHRLEEYVPTKPKIKAFAGRGHKLGSPSPATVGMTVPTNPADQVANESQARSQLNLDINSPVTTIQIRLADGQNVREQFNLSHTVGDIRRFITTMRPQYANQEFVLLTSYPSKELDQDNITINEAGIMNSALLQRFK